MSSDWFFFDGGPGSPRYGDDPTKHAVSHDTETFVREVLQNANDQSLDDSEEPVQVRFKFFSLKGDELEEFKRSIDWDGLLTHVRGVARTDRGRGYRQFIEGLEEEEELRLLAIEDRNTTGLTGSWGDNDSNYTALVRDELFSNKQDDTAGGSYGLGKSVLWTFSGLSTVVFSSTIDQSDRANPRLIGRSKLPTHTTEEGGAQFQGAGWFCRVEDTPDGGRPVSFWGEEAEQKANDLRIARPETTGTTALVLGFRDPTRDERPDFQELSDQFVTASAKYFWPAIHRGDLEVTVETPLGTTEATPEACPMVLPFVRAYSSRFHGGNDLEQPGDVAARDLGVRIPPRADGSSTDNAKAILSVKLASPGDDYTLLNKVALFRGTGMVVKYYDQSRVAPRDRDFFAVLACGEARTPGKPSAGDVELDRFLRFAEPPTHDDWESTEKLREHYQRGYRKAIVRLTDDLREGLRNLVSRPLSGGGRLPDTVLRKFPIHSKSAYERTQSNQTSGEPAFELDGSASYSEGHWQFFGSVKPIEGGHEGWTAAVRLTRMGEDGGTVAQIPLANVETESRSVSCRVNGVEARIVAEPGVDEVVFNGKSDIVGEDDFASGKVGEIRLEIDAELETEENQA